MPEATSIAGAALTKAWEIFNREFLALFHIIVLLHLPLNVVAGFFPEITGFQSMPLAAIFFQLTSFVLSVLSSVAIIFLTLQYLARKPVNAETALSQGLQIFFPAAVTIMTAALITGLLTLLLIVPGIIFLVYTVFLTQIIVAQRKFFTEAIRASIGFVKGRWWYVFACIGLILLAVLFATMILSLIFDTVSDNAFGKIMGLMVLEVSSKFLTVSMTVLYVELKKTSTQTS